MDSRLLNAYHDDPYDSNYDQFESSAADLWSTDNIGIGGMDLADTLDGILPITATETGHDICNIMFDDNHLYDDKEFIRIRNPNALVYNDFTQQQLKAEERVGTIETDLLNDDGCYSNSESKNFGNTYVERDAIIDDDARSQCSEYSFRTRTESSSIGDYESHSSDYDDDYDEDDVAKDGDDYSDFNEEELEKDILSDSPKLNVLNTDDFMFTANGKKQRTMSTNTIGSDVDAMNFDLAEFITKDDVPAKLDSTKISQKEIIKSVVQVISPMLGENDSDSDVIVDVETVEFEEAKERALLLKNVNVQLPEDNLAYVDNVKEDPSWSPKELKAKPTSNKKQSDILKSGKSRGKCATSMKSNNKVGGKKQVLKSTPTNVQISCPNVGVGKGGKNLSLLKRDCESIEDDANQSRVKEKDIALLKHDSHRIDPRIQNRETLIKKTETEKRKLNLEEYKRRHGEDFSNILKTNPIENKSIATEPKKAIINSKPQTPTKVKAHSEAVTSIVKSLKAERIHDLNHKTDPITQAKNKVLRMQELKKAQQLRIIDSTISAKVPRVTKLLPLQEIIKDTAYAIKNEEVKELKPQLYANTDYVKIVMVSAACNTALSLSPTDMLPNAPLLDNITRVTEKVKISNNSLITSIQDAVVKQSLPKITYPTIVSSAACPADLKKLDAIHSQHGEDKIIMHLRKDRIRGPTRTIAIQTDFHAAFPTLPLPERIRKSHGSKNGPSRRKYRKRNISTASSSSGSSQSDNDSNHGRCDNDSDVEYISTKQNHHRNNDCVSSIEYQNSEAAASVGGYSSRSSRRHRSSVSSSYSESGHQRSSRSRKRQSSYRKSVRKHTRSSSSSSSLSEYSDRSRSRSRSRTHNRTRSRSPYYKDSRTRYDTSSSAVDRNVSKPAVEERRIVYVGRIEEETTKEILRRKFIVYGSIKQITIHYKETGMKYGFVTFERSQDAFSAIDNSPQDSQINMYDISFGGRRAFCRTSYADLDNAGINNYHSYVFPKVVAPPKSEDSFEALLQKVKAKLDANKSSNNNKT